MELIGQAARRAELRREALAELDLIQKERSRLLSERAMTWMALVPYWPLEIVSSLPNPLGGVQVPDAFRAAETEGLLTSGNGPFPWTGPIYWMKDSVRDSVLRDLIASHSPDFVRKELVESAAAMRKFGGRKVTADLALWRWTELALAAESLSAVQRKLKAVLDEALQVSPQSGPTSAPDALRWIETAEPLGRVFGGAIEAGVVTAKRRFELFHRRAHDERLLHNFLVREEPRDAFLALLGDSEHWALHYIGSGGTGKTMLLRHLTVNLARERRLAVARVDFDYLNPDYPERNPGLLLMALAEELRLQAGPDAERAFYRFEEISSSLHREIEGASRQGRTVQASIQDPAVQEALNAFAEALWTINRNGRTVLILDTCEELAKFQPGPAISPNVARTFEMLEEIHRRIGEVRVVFSGRRPLPERPYLAVHRIQGFSRSEAERFLRAYGAADRKPVRGGLFGGILKLSRSLEGADERYNPYDLDMYASWAAADPSLTEEALDAAGAHYYVKERIVGRLAPAVRSLLPSLVLLGRFDRDLLEQLVGPGDRAGSLLIEIVAQEWIHPDLGGGPDAWLMDNPLRLRLLRYYRDEDRAAYHSARLKLAEILPDLTLSRPFSNLNPQYFATALDVLRDVPERAAEWWDKVEARIAAEAAWAWAAELMKFLEPENAAPAAGPGSPAVTMVARFLAQRIGAPGYRRDPLRAALLATRAAVVLHTGEEDRKPIWEQALVYAYDHPIPGTRDRLRFRALCALSPDDAFFQEWLPEITAQEQASALAQYEKVLDRAESEAQRGALSGPDHWPAAAPEPPELAAFRVSLAARSLRLRGQNDPARQQFQDALEFASQAGGAGQVWLDWLKPDDLGARIELEAIRCFSDFLSEDERFFLSPDERFSVRHAARLPLRTIDADRLASAWLIEEERRMPLSANPDREAYLASYESSLQLMGVWPLWLTRRIYSVYYPPFFVALLVARAMDGEVEQALGELRNLSRSSIGGPVNVTRAIDAAISWIAWRMRLQPEGVSVATLADDSRELEYGQLEPLRFQALRWRSWKLPSRRAGRTFDAAELALVRGDRVDDLLGQAFQQYEAASDNLGCFQSLVLHGLWLAARGEQDEARRRAGRALEFYKRIAERAGLPSTEEIQTQPPAALLDRLGPKPAVWRPWIARLLVCLAGPDNHELRSWLLENYALTTDGRRVLPRELAFLAPPQQHAAAPAAAAPQSSRHLVRDIAVLAAGLVVLGLALSFLYQRLPDPVRGALFGGALIYILIKRLFEVVRAIQFRVETKYNEPVSDLNRPLATPGALIYRMRLLGFPLATRRLVELSPCDAESYAELAARVLPGSQKDTALTRILGPQSLRLTVDSSTAAAPWEYLLPRFVVRRVTSDIAPASLPEWRAPVGFTVWSRTHQSLSEYSKLDRRRFEVVTAARATRSMGVLHMVGTPTDTRGRTAFRLESGEFIRTDHLIADFPSLRLCIVQCPPAEITSRLRTDRLNAAVLKRVGAEIFASGVPAVLVVPVVPPESSFALQASLASVLNKTPRNAVPRLEAAVRDFRQRLVRAGHPTPADAREIAADVCLYARDRVSFRVSREAWIGSWLGHRLGLDRALRKIRAA